MARERFASAVLPHLRPLPATGFVNENGQAHLRGFLIRMRARGEVGLLGSASESWMIVPAEGALPDLLAVDAEDGERALISAEAALHAFLPDCFPQDVIVEITAFRGLTPIDFELDRSLRTDLLSAVEEAVNKRGRGEMVCLEISDGASWGVAETLRRWAKLEPRHVVRRRACFEPALLERVEAVIDRPAWRFPVAVARHEPTLRNPDRLFEEIAKKDRLLHHPFDSFRPVLDFLDTAARDPKVVAIKQLLFRANQGSPLLRALSHAAENGKQVTVVVELRTRFEETVNAHWARELQRSGAHVVYGRPDLQTHANLSLVVRREGARLRRYLHFSTGGYEPSSAREQTDYAILSANPAMTEDAARIFNTLTGFGRWPDLQHLVLGPFDLRHHLLARIQRETEHAARGHPSGIRLKLNTLTDPQLIEALYEASRRGVPVDILVRAACGLRPFLDGLVAPIRVRSRVSRFLEHGRLFVWTNGGEQVAELCSGDWTPRTMDERVDLLVPILDGDLLRRVLDDVSVEDRDDADTWHLDAPNAWHRVGVNGAPSLRDDAVHEVLLERAMERGTGGADGPPRRQMVPPSEPRAETTGTMILEAHTICAKAFGRSPISANAA
ncbi:MAG: hypothetical protein HC923_02495 [Myxococcales bacterium]|nr:hypothetical protein [Myxococcales bacterium]